MASTVASSQLAQRYQIINQLGSGGMGVVYRALDRLSGQVVALKQVTVRSDQLLFASRADERVDMRLALAHEFKTLASLRHPNIVSVLDYGFDAQHQPFFTMKLLEDAQTILQAGRGQSAELRYNLLVQLLQALVYLHRRGILHRDLKPGNVLVVNGQVKVLDFGLSIAHGEQGSTSGTLAYMAPELFKGALASEGSDLYAVGIMAYELFVGQHPFRLEPIHLLLSDIINCSPDMSTFQPGELVTHLVERLISKEPAARYRDAAEVLAAFSAASGQQLATETALTRESFLQAALFVGREAELGQLSAVLAEALSGRGTQWLIGGESGIGKSRLLEELRTLALVEGALVLRGQAVSEGGTPYLIWRDMLRQLCLYTELNDLERSVLKPLVPDIGALLGRTVPDAPELDPQATHERLTQVISDVFSRQPQPTVAILEDLQWAGAESIAVLKRLIVQMESQALLVVGSYRSDERPGLPGELPGAHVLVLKRLPREHLADLSSSILGEVTGRENTLVDFLADETEGNVFFIVEVLRALAEEAGQLDRINIARLPRHVFSGGMKAVIQRRLNQVPTWAQTALQKAAIAGRGIDPRLLQAVEPEMDVDDWLTTCTDARVLEFQDNQWRFGHDKLREGTLEGLSDYQRGALHQQIALGIESCYPDDPTRAAALAGHWGGAGNVEKEAHYARLAGQQAAAIGANREAIRYLERADTLSVQVNMPPDRRVQIRYLTGMAYYGLGNLAEAEQQLHRALHLGGFVQPTGTTATVVRILGRLVREGWQRLMLDVLKRSQRSSPQSPLFGMLSQVCTQLCQIYYISNHRYSTFYYALLAVHLAELAGPAYSQQQAYGYAVTMAVMGAIPLHLAARHYQQLTQAATRASNDVGTRIWAELMQGVYTSGRAQWAAANQHLEVSARISDQIGDARRWSESLIVWGIGLILQGNWPEASKLLHDVYLRNLQHGDWEMQAGGLLFGGAILMVQGDLEQTTELLKPSYELLKQASDRAGQINFLGLWAQRCLRLGMVEVAEDYLGQFLATPGLDTPITLWLLFGYVAAADVALSLCEQTPSATHLTEARNAVRAMRHLARIFDTGQPFMHLYDGWLAWLEGKSRRAEKFGEKAIHAAQKLQLPYTEGLAHYHLGRHLPPTNAMRTEHLRQAEAIFQRLGAAYDLVQTRQELL